MPAALHTTHMINTLSSMAPLKIPQKAMLTGNEKIKLRKPAVEKMRRDRINSSIQQLRSLLEKELEAQQPSSKLEKADILEAAVGFLKEKRRPTGAAAPPGHGFVQGFLRCLEETVRFLSVTQQPPGQKLLQLLQRVHLQGGGVKGVAGRQCLWRPWR